MDWHPLARESAESSLCHHLWAQMHVGANLKQNDDISLTLLFSFFFTAPVWQPKSPSGSRVSLASIRVSPHCTCPGCLWEYTPWKEMPPHCHGMVWTSSRPPPSTALCGSGGSGRMWCLRWELGELSELHGCGSHSKPFVVCMGLVGKCVAAPANLYDGRMTVLNQKINLPVLHGNCPH